MVISACAISDRSRSRNKKRQAKDGKTDTQTLASTKKCCARPWRLEAILLQSSFHRARVVARLGLVHRGEVTVESYQTHAIAGREFVDRATFSFFSRGPTIKSREFWDGVSGKNQGRMVCTVQRFPYECAKCPSKPNAPDRTSTSRTNFEPRTKFCHIILRIF